jgi:GNAT superfamily N-acetyltransferase
VTAGASLSLDTMADPSARGRGIGGALVAAATAEARAAGCEWLHVDFEDHLTGFYVDRAGFRPTRAGLIRLIPQQPVSVPYGARPPVS